MSVYRKYLIFKEAYTSENDFEIETFAIEGDTSTYRWTDKRTNEDESLSYSK